MVFGVSLLAEPGDLPGFWQSCLPLPRKGPLLPSKDDTRKPYSGNRARQGAKDGHPPSSQPWALGAICRMGDWEHPTGVHKDEISCIAARQNHSQLIDNIGFLRHCNCTYTVVAGSSSRDGSQT
jgi:hypothetical protein